MLLFLLFGILLFKQREREREREKFVNTKALFWLNGWDLV